MARNVPGNIVFSKFKKKNDNKELQVSNSASPWLVI